MHKVALLLSMWYISRSLNSLQLKNIVIRYDIGNLWTSKSDRLPTFPWNDCRTEPIIEKRLLIICQIFMFPSIRNFENSLIIPSKNVSLAFQCDFYHPNIHFFHIQQTFMYRTESFKERQKTYSILHTSILQLS